MKTKMLLMVFASFILSLATVYGQKVVVENGKVIIDCAGMPAGAVTDVKKARATSWTATTPAGTDLSDISSAQSNEKVYKRFEIHKTVNNSGELLSWKKAIDHCKNLSTENGGWRLPTQRELMLIWVLRPALTVGGVTDLAIINYWSATTDEADGQKSWIVNFLDIGGNTITHSKTNENTFRCIRDL